MWAAPSVTMSNWLWFSFLQAGMIWGREPGKVRRDALLKHWSHWARWEKNNAALNCRLYVCGDDAVRLSLGLVLLGLKKEKFALRRFAMHTHRTKQSGTCQQTENEKITNDEEDEDWLWSQERRMTKKDVERWTLRAFHQLLLTVALRLLVSSHRDEQTHTQI